MSLSILTLRTQECWSVCTIKDSKSVCVAFPVFIWMWTCYFEYRIFGLCTKMSSLSARSVPLAVDKNNIHVMECERFLLYYAVMCLLTQDSSRARPPAGWILEHPFPAKLSQSRSESLWLAVHSFGCSHPWAAGQTNQMDKHEASNSLINVYSVNACNNLTLNVFLTMN